MDRKRVLVVDPILRASRLYITFLISDAFLRNAEEVHILTREDWHTKQFDELFNKSDNVTIISKVSLPNGFWYGKIPIRNVLQVHKFLKNSSYDKVVFSGVNEFYPYLHFLNFFSNTFERCNRIVLIDYHTNYLFPFSHNLYWKHFVNKVLKNLVGVVCLSSKKIVFAHMDDRILDHEFFDKKLSIKHHFLPDPSPDVFGRLDFITEDKHDENQTRILVVGTQTKRKGLDDIFSIISNNKSIPENIQFHLVGRLSDETEKYRKALEDLPQEILIWDEGFFSDSEIRSFYQDCDFVILPYLKSFTSSSGVMAYASSYGKPMISTSHGCIGYRVRAYNMGFTYISKDIKALSKILYTLPGKYSNEYSILRDNAFKFALDHSVKHFQKSICNIA